eukprot:COSAG05_NODE_13801_length_417_cov_12.669811_1_plen_45_part_01
MQEVRGALSLGDIDGVLRAAIPGHGRLMSLKSPNVTIGKCTRKCT